MLLIILNKKIFNRMENIMPKDEISIKNNTFNKKNIYKVFNKIFHRYDVVFFKI